jgi:hypothetical protein
MLYEFLLEFSNVSFFLIINPSDKLYKDSIEFIKLIKMF